MEILLRVLLTEYPPMPEDGKMKWKLLLPEKILDPQATKIRLFGLEGGDKPEATWKEIVILKHRKLLMCFNYVSYGRYEQTK